jgi:peptide/nickel transport system permease protein
MEGRFLPRMGLYVAYALIADGLKAMRNAPWVAWFPGLAIMLVVLGFNLLGDDLRDALDPRLRRSRS